ncbi:hypothetical protein QDY63_14835 [Pseudomonas brenneri]|uniref:hypothetical protein n=1 Tax=Pseudomonas brenneri TaxID=129817 RepID=UPI0025A228E8|nr:hypothetical protein [Pseudomonas brenneri]WJM88676.1 hypothetical protein QDY63_14835 [Pseudomonas brenneri]
MFQALIVKVLVQFGTSLLLNLATSIVTTLQTRKDNDLDVGAETVKLILKQVSIK